jgi:Flp pilus assembly pilin Flp
VYVRCVRLYYRVEARKDVLNRRNPMVALLVRTFAPLRSDEEGQTLVEYALILLLVSTAAVALLSSLGVFASSAFSSINADF